MVYSGGRQSIVNLLEQLNRRSYVLNKTVHVTIRYFIFSYHISNYIILKMLHKRKFYLKKNEFTVLSH